MTTQYKITRADLTPNKTTLADIRGERHHDMPDNPATPKASQDMTRENYGQYIQRLDLPDNQGNWQAFLAADLRATAGPEPQDLTADASQNRENYNVQIACGPERLEGETLAQYLTRTNKANAQAASAHTLGIGEPSGNAGPTPTEYGDRWEPLREKLTVHEAQYLNTYTRTGDIAALNCLVLGIISQRDETAADRDRLNAELAYARKMPAELSRQLDQAREQVKTLLGSCKMVTTAVQAFDGQWEPTSAELNSLHAAIASVESEGK